MARTLKPWEDSLKMICGFCLVRPDELSVQLCLIKMMSLPVRKFLYKQHFAVYHYRYCIAPLLLASFIELLLILLAAYLLQPCMPADSTFPAFVESYCTSIMHGPVKRLDQRSYVRYSMQSSKGCVRLRDALKCVGMHFGGYHYSDVEMMKLKAAETYWFLSHPHPF